MAKEIFAGMREANKLFPLNTSPEQQQSAAGASDRALTSDLTKLCLPQEFRDSNRKLAWVNSICLLFLMVGVVGLKSPPVQSRQTKVAIETMPVMLVLAEPTTVSKPSEFRTTLEPLADAPIERPVVASVVTAEANVAFAVPVAEPPALLPARVTRAGTTEGQSAASKSTPYVPSEADWGGHKLEYPPLAARHGYQGKVVLEILVAPSGGITSVRVRESSGYKVLDDAALEHVRRYLRLRQAPGETRLHTLDIVFQLKS